MSYLFYVVLHVSGALALLAGVGGLAATASQPDGAPGRKPYQVLHGVGLLFLLVGGFGALARAKYGFPAWIAAKLLLWLWFATLPLLLKRMPHAASVVLWIAWLVGVAALTLARTKPF